MSSDFSTTKRSPSPWLPVAWSLGAFLLAALLFLDPLGLHPLDERLRGSSDSSPSAEMPGMQAHGPGHHDHGEEEALWTCSMHPQVLEDGPGACPICGMNLVPVSAGSESEMGIEMGSPAGAAEDGTLWTCSMHPQVLEDEPGACPICGMDLVPVKAGGDDDGAGEWAGPVVSIDSSVLQSMNVRTEPARLRDLARSVRTVGNLEYDPETMITVTTKYSGWAEKVYVHYLGEKVRRGQPLFEIYSPELVQTQQELLAARHLIEELEHGTPEARERAESLVEAIRLRLAFWDVAADQVRRLEETQEPLRTLTVRSPAAGVVMKRMPALEGMAVKPGMELFHIADLSSLWLTVEVFEEQVPWIGEGSTAEVTFTHLPDETFTGRVRYIEPQLSEETRTLGVKLEIPNRGGLLRAGMFATVVFRPPVAEGVVTVPSQALLRTGERDLVIVALGQGRFAPREVTAGWQADGYTEIRSGLEAGEEVVTSSQFLIDSESNLRAAVRQLLDAAEAGRAVPSSGKGDGNGMEGMGHAH